MENHSYMPVPPGLVDDVAKRCYETICESAEVSVSDGRGTAWDTVGDEVRETWRAVARQAVAATLNRMIHEGWLVVKPANMAQQEPKP